MRSCSTKAIRVLNHWVIFLPCASLQVLEVRMEMGLVPSQLHFTTHLHNFFFPVTITLRLFGFQVWLSKVEEMLPYIYIEILHWIAGLIKGYFRCFMPPSKRDTTLQWLMQLILIIKVCLGCCYTVVRERLWKSGHSLGSFSISIFNAKI